MSTKENFSNNFKYKKIIEEIIEKALFETNLEEKKISQILYYYSNELKNSIVLKLKELSVSDSYSSEKIGVRYGLFSRYRPKNIGEQINFLRKVFPSLRTFNESIVNKPLPPGAEGLFAIPRYELIYSSDIDAIKGVLNLIKEHTGNRFYNWCGDKINNLHWRRSEQFLSFWNKLKEQQGDCDILIVPAQFGFRYRGFSCRNVRTILKNRSLEFGLGIFEVGIMLLTHPERLSYKDDLWIDCVGDEYSKSVIGSYFEHVPCFSFNGNKIDFDVFWDGRVSWYSGSATAFLFD